MKFSVEKATFVKKRKQTNLREEMIKKENLHIEDLITYEEFLRLYDNYGKGFTEKEFAEVFLDIKKTDLDHFKEGGNRKILRNEVIDDIDICLTKLHLIRTLNLKKGKEKYYNEIEEIYNSIPSKLNIITFSEKVLDILRTDLAKIKHNRTKRKKILNKTDDEYFSGKDEVELEKYITDMASKKKNYNSNLRDTIAMDINLHMKDPITKEKFMELFEIYGENEFSQLDFAKEILGMSESQTIKLMSGEIKEAQIWKNEVLDLDYLLKIRENTIFSEDLHIRDEINYKQFKEIYKKYSGILSESDFATEILDMAKRGFCDFQRKNCKCKILYDIEVPEEFYPDTKKQIQEKEDVYFGKSITYEEFQKLYKKYGFITNEMEFAKEVLEISKKGFPEFKDGTVKTKKIFLESKRISHGEDTIEYTPKEIKKLREIVIKENKLHIEDRVTGEQFTNIYNKYGSGMSQKTFAVQILDIDENRLSDIINDYEKRKRKENVEGNEERAIILRNETVSDREIKHMRKVIFKVNEHSKGDPINYEEFKRLHNLYGGRLSEEQFAEKIIFIPVDRLWTIRSNSSRNTAIFWNLKISDAYIANLKAKVIRKNLLFFRQRITPKFLTKIYGETPTVLSKPKFAEKILEINRHNYYDSVDSGRHSSCEILSISGTMENHDNFFRKRDKTIVQMLKDGASYNEIEDEVNITHHDLLNKTKEIFRNELDKYEIARKHIFVALSTNSELESEFTKMVDIKEFDRIKSEAEEPDSFFRMENRCKRIMEEFTESDEDTEYVKEYIHLCKDRYYKKLHQMPMKTLKVLNESLEFAKYDEFNLDDSLFFVRACIEHMDYKRANTYITFNMHNNNITTDQKKKLQELRKAVREASQRTDEVLNREYGKKERIMA